MAGTPAYAPRDLLENPSEWVTASSPTWRKADSLEAAAKVVLAVEQHRVAWMIRRRLSRAGETIGQLAYATGVGERQLKAKLAGQSRMQLEELLVWRWRLGDRRAISVPDPAELLGPRAAGARPDRWPLPE